jgi:hypothetical protein
MFKEFLTILALISGGYTAGAPKKEYRFAEGDTFLQRMEAHNQGVREYTIDGVTVRARNFKNAERKVRKPREITTI